MNIREWALITFTILAQMSVGSFVILGVVHNYAIRKAGMKEADRLSDRALFAVGFVLLLGLAASLFHLGVPWKAYRAVTNINTSWLSREILSGVLFAFFGAVFTFLQWRKIGSFSSRNIVAWIAVLIGLALLYCMSRVYLLPTEPSWNSLATPITFFTTAFLLGALAIGVAFVANYSYLQRNQNVELNVQRDLLRDSLRGIAIASLILLGVEFVVLPIYLASLSAGPAAAVQSAKIIVGTYAWVLVLRLILEFVGAGIFALFLYKNALSAGKEKILGNLIYAAFAFVLVAEVLGRFLFYAARVRIGI
ncbi:MAG: dimethyl sulfoxide reductase anchor subunit family protein [Anaerolineales bacterium]